MATPRWIQADDQESQGRCIVAAEEEVKMEITPEQLISLNIEKMILGVLRSFNHDHPEWAMPSEGFGSLAKRLNGQFKVYIKAMRRELQKRKDREVDVPKERVVCPYCVNENEIDAERAKTFRDRETGTQRCLFCNYVFGFEVRIHRTYEPSTLDCSKGGTHIWERTGEAWKCSLCGLEMGASPPQGEVKEGS